MPAHSARRKLQDEEDLELPPLPSGPNALNSDLARIRSMFHTYNATYTEYKKRKNKEAEQDKEKKIRKEARKKKKAKRRKLAAAEERRTAKLEAAEAKQAARDAARAEKQAAVEKEKLKRAAAAAERSNAKQNSTAPKKARKSREAAASPVPPARVETSPFLAKLPLEVREVIYTHLLAPDPTHPFRVCKGWTETLKGRDRRKRREIYTAIMRTNSQIADECIRVLYGKNEFEYRLRDAVLPNTTSGAGSRRFHGEDAGDTYVASDSDSSSADSDDEYVEAPSRPQPRRTVRSSRTRVASAGRAPSRVIPPHEAFNPSVQINITKFGHHCRRVRIVAESGRDTPEYRGPMAQAISTFCNLFPLRSRLHTLTMEIQPEQLSEHKISFADFFRSDTDVIQALRRLPCQYIKFLIHTERVNKETGLKQAEFTLDLRPAASIRRAMRGERDMWANNQVAMKQRKEAALTTQKQMLELPDAIEQAWGLVKKDKRSNGQDLSQDYFLLADQ